jgi:hypothetical protein
MRRLYYIVSFIAAFVCVMRIHRAIEAGGYSAARDMFLLPWIEGRKELPCDDYRTAVISLAVQDACDWQNRRTECLHRAIAAYTLLRRAGARPRFVMATRSLPFASHAWCEVDGHVVADDVSEYCRNEFTPIFTIPNTKAVTNTLKGLRSA